MKKQLVILGIVDILVCIALSGCNSKLGINLTNIGDINTNPENYINKSVTVEGSCVYVQEFGWIADDNNHTIMFKYQHSLNGKYRLIGVVKENPPYFSSLYYIDVVEANSL